MERSEGAYMANYLLKVYEVFDAAVQRLPQLQNVDINLVTCGWGFAQYTRFQVRLKQGDLWVDYDGWNDSKFGFQHSFAALKE